MSATDDLVVDGVPVALRDGSHVRIARAAAPTASCCCAAFSA